MSGVQGPDDVQRVDAVAGLQDLVAAADEQHGHEVTVLGDVVDDQNGCHDGLLPGNAIQNLPRKPLRRW
jgi:hypothetical protein